MRPWIKEQHPVLGPVFRLSLHPLIVALAYSCGEQLWRYELRIFNPLLPVSKLLHTGTRASLPEVGAAISGAFCSVSLP